MNDTAGPVPVPGSDIDPQVRRFIDAIGAAWRQHASLPTLTYPQQRQIAELVRAPWAAGGPVMTSSVDIDVPSKSGSVRVRVHDPAPQGAKPALIYLHGGGWTLFSIDTHDRLMREYAARARCIVIGVDYALSPEAKFPTALEQVLAVARWLRDGGVSGVRPDRIAVGGDSAGGNLTMATCVSLRDAGEGGLVSAMLLNYAALDPQCTLHSQQRFGVEPYMLTQDEMAGFWRNYLRDAADADNPLVNLSRARLEQLPPAFFAIAECDLLAQQNLDMVQRLRAAGVEVEAVVYEGAAHSFLEAVSVAEVADRALSDASQWLRRRLG